MTIDTDLQSKSKIFIKSMKINRKYSTDMNHGEEIF